MILEARTSAAVRVETVRGVGSMNGRPGTAKRIARRRRRRPSGTSLDVNTAFELGRRKRYDSAVVSTYFLRIPQLE